MKNIFDYDDYREFIKDYISECQIRNARFSLRAFAKKVNVSSGHLSLILQGKKHLSEKYLLLLSKVMGLCEEEIVHFLLLVDYDSSVGEVKTALKRHVDIRKAKIKITYQKLDKKKFYLKWEHLLILVLVEIVSEKKELIKQATLLIDKESAEIIKLLNELIDSGKFIKESQGFLTRLDERVVLESLGANESMRIIHKKYLEESIKFVDKKEASERFSVTEFIEVPKNSIKDLRRLTNEYLDQVSVLKDKQKLKGDILGISLHLNRFNLN